MSLNWREIDAVIDELALRGAFIQQVIQPDFRNLWIEIYRPGQTFFLRICLETGRTRIHSETGRPRKPTTRQRFAQFANARLRGARVGDVAQVNADRIVRIDCRRADEPSIVWIRLWGGAANVVVTDADWVILDAFYRRPKRGEVSGGRFALPDSRAQAGVATRSPAEFAPRWTRDVNRATRDHYREVERDERRTVLLERARSSIESSLSAASRRQSEIREQLARVESGSAGRHYGDLIMTNLHLIEPGARWVTCDDYETGESVTLELDPGLSPAENGARYYERAKRDERRSTALKEDAVTLDSRVVRLERTLARLDSMDEDGLEALVADGSARRTTQRTSDAQPGLEFERHGFSILVGRNARENDELLRRYVRGNDLWLHTRDYPGGYVFVRSRPGKSVPLDVLLDAGNLAVHFSKARPNGRADLYYTSVKYLRRAKTAPIGTVLPTQEKNLSVTVDRERLAEILGNEPVRD